MFCSDVVIVCVAFFVSTAVYLTADEAGPVVLGLPTVQAFGWVGSWLACVTGGYFGDLGHGGLRGW